MKYKNITKRRIRIVSSEGKSTIVASGETVDLDLTIIPNGFIEDKDSKEEKKEPIKKKSYEKK